jgi:branched-subunit amino acid transport protein AzlD
MGFLHLAQAIAIFILSKDYSVTGTTSFLSWNQTTGAPESVIKPLVDFPIGPMVAAFLLISSAAHFIMASPRFYPWYVHNLKKGINYLRWYEYALSASLMVVLIGMLSGIFDVPIMILLFALTAGMNFFGLEMELRNQGAEKVDWTPFVFGSIIGFIPWIVIAWYFFAALSSSTEAVPTFVYFILGILFVFFFSFAFNMWLQYKKVGPWKSYLFGERVYMILSLTAKSALAWQIFGGTLRGF